MPVVLCARSILPPPEILPCAKEPDMVRQCTTEQMCETRTLTRPTERWQDKSREVRRGRSAGKRAMIKDLAQCAPAHESLPDRASHCKYRQERTSRSDRDDTRR